MIWCVEDDSSIRDIEVYALVSTGFEARGFEDGDSFWNALQSEKPDLVVLDVMLPGKDGVTLLKMMKASEEFRDIPVIMATAKGSEYDKIQSLDLGADDYLVKPSKSCRRPQIPGLQIRWMSTHILQYPGCLHHPLHTRSSAYLLVFF